MNSCSSAQVKLVDQKVFLVSKLMLGCYHVLCGWAEGTQPSASSLSVQDAAHLESGQPVQYESDVVVYLQECEGLIRQLQVDVQILRDENYYQLEELVFR